MELLQLLLASLILLVTGTAVLLLLTGFFPHEAAQGQTIIEQMPGRALLIGLVNLFFLSALTLTLFALGENVAPLFFIPALASLFTLIAAILLGLPGLVLLLGQRLWPDKPPVNRHAFAAGLLLLAGLAPFVGWFVLTPILLTIALGVGVMLLMGRARQRRARQGGASATKSTTSTPDP